MNVGDMLESLEELVALPMGSVILIQGVGAAQVDERGGWNIVGIDAVAQPWQIPRSWLPAKVLYIGGADWYARLCESMK